MAVDYNVQPFQPVQEILKEALRTEHFLMERSQKRYFLTTFVPLQQCKFEFLLDDFEHAANLGVTTGTRLAENELLR